MINYNAPDQNPKPQSKYGNLAFTPKDFERHWWIETSLKPEYLQETFKNPGNAGPLQLTRPAFDDLKRFGYFKEKTFDQLTPQEALAGSMIYKTKLKENYGLDNPGWNIVGYKEGPTLARRFKDRHNGDLLKAMADPEFPEPARKYVLKYLKADRELRDKEPPAVIKDMYQAILKGDDVNKVDFKKYIVPKAQFGLEVLGPLLGGGGSGGAQALAGMLGGSGGGENDKLKKFAPKMPTAEDIMFMPKFTKAMGPLGPIATAAGDMIGMQEDADKQDFIAGTALSGIGGFLSAGPVGGILGLGSGLVKYGFNAADNARQKQQEEQSFIKSRTISGRDGLENPLVYAQKGIEIKGTKYGDYQTKLPPIYYDEQQREPLTKEERTLLDSFLVENSLPKVNVYIDEPNLRPYYRYKENSMHVRNNFSDIIAELAHARQWKPRHSKTKDPQFKTLDYITGKADQKFNTYKKEITKRNEDLDKLFKLLKKQKSVLEKYNYKLPGSEYDSVGDSISYRIPGTIEYDAHSIIEPILQKEYETRQNNLNINGNIEDILSIHEKRKEAASKKDMVNPDEKRKNRLIKKIQKPINVGNYFINQLLDLESKNPLLGDNSNNLINYSILGTLLNKAEAASTASAKPEIYAQKGTEVPAVKVIGVPSKLNEWTSVSGNILPGRHDDLLTNYNKAKKFIDYWHFSPQYKKMLFTDQNPKTAQAFYDKRVANLKDFHAKGTLGTFDPEMEPNTEAYTDYVLSAKGPENIVLNYNRKIDPSYSTVLHELSHVTDMKRFGDRDWTIPKKDEELIRKYTPSNLQNSTDKTINYFKRPTEVRSRLQEIRLGSYNQGHDVFEKPFEKSHLESIKDLRPYQDLKKVFSDDAILEFLNNISTTNPQQVPIAQLGGAFSSKGDPWEYMKSGNSFVTRKKGSTDWMNINPAGATELNKRISQGVYPEFTTQPKPTLTPKTVAADMTNPSGLKKGIATDFLKNNWDKVEDTLGVASVLPFVGAPAAAALAVNDFSKGNYGSAAINAAGALTSAVGLPNVFKGATMAAKAMKGLWNATKFGTDALGKAGAVSTLQKYMPGQESQNFALGGYSIKGYKEDSPDKDNPYNLIPGNRITMEGVRRALMAIPISNGIPMGIHMMKPGEEYEFEDADEVLEIPKKELGGLVEGQELELTDAEIKALIRKGYKLQVL